MKKIFIVKKEQLESYIDDKKSNNTFYEIIEKLHNNKKFLNENVSIENANQSIINTYKRKGLITPKIYEMLIKHKVMNEKYEII
jgi:hypothetical protein